MLPKALLAAALVASPAAAILLPSTFGAEVVNDKAAFSKDIKLACPGCALRVHKHHNSKEPADIVTLTDVPNHLSLRVDVKHTENEKDRLTINGFEIFPNVDVNNALTAFQFPDHPRKHHPGHRQKGETKGKKEDDAEQSKESKKESEKEPKKASKPVVESPKEEAKEEVKEEAKDVEPPMEDIKRDNSVKGHRKHKQNKEHVEHKEHKEHMEDWEVIDPKKEGVPSKHARPHHHGKFVAAKLGYSVQLEEVGAPVANEPNQGDAQVYRAHVRIIQVNDKFAMGVPELTIVFMSDSKTGAITVYQIARDETKPAIAQKPNHPHHSSSGSASFAQLEKELSECTNIICRWKVMMEARLRAMASKCSGSRTKGHHGQGFQSEDSMRPHHAGHGRPHDEEHKDMGAFSGQRPHHHAESQDDDRRPFHHRVHKHSWVQLAKKFVTNILFPVMVGVASGLLVSFLGMVIGRALYRAWHLVFRRGEAPARIHSHPAYQVLHTETVETVAVVSEVARKEEGSIDEKAGLMSMPEPSQTELPPYEEADPKTTEN